VKVVAIREAKASLSATLAEAQTEQVVITKRGRPVALVTGVEGYDMEDVMTVANPKFWKMLEARRGEAPTISIEAALDRFAAEDDRAASKRGRPAGRARRRRVAARPRR